MRIRHISAGYEKLHKAPAAQRDLERRAARIAAAAGDNTFAESSAPIRKRNRAAVIALGGDSENRLLRSIDAGR